MAVFATGIFGLNTFETVRTTPVTTGGNGAYVHRELDARACGAGTVVTGQNFVRVDGRLWSVNGDPNNHGAGNLNTSRPWITINGKGVICRGNSAAPDNLCPPLGGAHCAPSAVGFSTLVSVE